MNKYRPTHNNKNQDGSIIVTILVVLIFLTALIFSLLTLSNANLQRARGRIMLLQAQYAAESGADAAIATFNSGNTSYTGTTSDTQLLNTSQYLSTYSVSVTDGANAKEKIIIATGKVYTPKTASTPSYTRKIRVVAQRSSSTTASSMLSRNIIDVGSGVKQITGRDIYVNGYIILNKNTTNLIGENITVVGKNTGSGNCSIGGTGNLVKPSSFSTSGQTKTNITIGYNNCISPPGNISNTDFNVTPNDPNLTPIQSTYIPWSQYMDSTYTAAGSCTDWTTGGSTREIPVTLGSKKTHYPDSGSNVSSSCGNSGNIDLGDYQYDITDNVHIRANFCANSTCDPVFNNPTATVKYIFIEGSVNFDSIKTASGSGPIVMIVYGTDPSSLTSVCPYGGAAYIGQSGSGYTDAPSLYLMAMNGLCINGTKFDSTSASSTAPVFGGISGKNIFVSSSPSTPRPLLLDPNFPIDQIPVDLAWREAYYTRL